MPPDLPRPTTPAFRPVISLGAPNHAGSEAVKASGELAYHVFYHALVAVVAYAGYGYSVSVGIVDVYVCAFG